VCFLWGLVSLLAWGLQRVLFKDGMVAAPSSCLPTLDSMYLQCLSQAGFVQHCQEKEELISALWEHFLQYDSPCQLPFQRYVGWIHSMCSIISSREQLFTFKLTRTP
jgi:hypothetical protein